MTGLPTCTAPRTETRRHFHFHLQPCFTLSFLPPCLRLGILLSTMPWALPMGQAQNQLMLSWNCLKRKTLFNLLLMGAVWQGATHQTFVILTARDALLSRDWGKQGNCLVHALSSFNCGKMNSVATLSQGWLLSWSLGAPFLSLSHCSSP